MCSSKKYHVEKPEGRGAITFTHDCEHASCSQRRTSCGGVHEARRKTKEETASLVGGTERAGNRMIEDVLTLQFGDVADEQVVFLAYGAPDRRM